MEQDISWSAAAAEKGRRKRKIRRKLSIICLFLCLSLVLSALSSAETAKKSAGAQEEIITNASVIKMVKAKLGESLIINKISSSKTNFDLSTDGLINLKTAGVSDKIVEVMMGGGATVSPVTQQTQTAIQQSPSGNPQGRQTQTLSGSSQLPQAGDFFIMQNGKLVEIEEHSGRKELSKGKMILTMGFGGESLYMVDGSKANIRIPSQENLTFISKIRIDPRATQAAGGSLFKLKIEDEKTRYIAGGGSAFSGFAGDIKEEYKVKYDVKKNPDGTYTISTDAPLAPGEYAFVVFSSGAADFGVRFFDFGVN
ncbi:MAG: hypothetical protein HZB81_05145 [Deltaproteobacteria bacterium]|nr:hypothetical protein [Deltaproteobacteria bacterium]